MGTQFSKIKVTQRVEVHGQVINDYYHSYYSNDAARFIFMLILRGELPFLGLH